MASPVIPAGTAGQQNVSAASASTFAPSKPVGTAAGELLLAIFYHEFTAAGVTMPTGFANLLAPTVSTGVQPTIRADWKIADGTEGTTISWALGATVWRVGSLFRITGGASGIATVVFENQASATNNTSLSTNNTTLPNTALTGSASVDDLAFLATCVSIDSLPSWSAPTGWTLRYNSSDDMGIVSQALASGAAAPTSTHVTLTDSGGGTGPGIALILAVKSSAGGAADPFPVAYRHYIQRPATRPKLAR